MLTSLQVCFNAVAPLFLIMALGYGAKCLGAISADAGRTWNLQKHHSPKHGRCENRGRQPIHQRY